MVCDYCRMFIKVVKGLWELQKVCGKAIFKKKLHRVKLRLEYIYLS